MSLLKHLSCHLILTLSVLTGADSADDFSIRWARCIFSSPDFSDMAYIDSFYFNKLLFTQFNSTLRRFVGFNEFGKRVAEIWNSGTFVQSERNGVSICQNILKSKVPPELFKAVKPKVKLISVMRAGSRHPVLMCSAYEFYPQHIKVSWLRDGKLMTSEVTSTMELADGDWYYQIHSELEYSPKSGEKISCMVEHASFNKPMIYDWDPSLPERNKIAIGASGLVLGIIIAAAGLIYYRVKLAGRILDHSLLT
ncbi:rano class II histocompatibility antigen, A beta chain-like [Chanodichthys erythropterus]|uniref:rano class II histocompatibility antigen, A beta chain-like n=1 Tax=Chanodichthys erythropterus TaxID=933992 RepID=UPI00351F196D